MILQVSYEVSSCSPCTGRTVRYTSMYPVTRRISTFTQKKSLKHHPEEPSMIGSVWFWSNGYVTKNWNEPVWLIFGPRPQLGFLMYKYAFKIAPVCSKIFYWKLFRRHVHGHNHTVWFIPSNSRSAFLSIRSVSVLESPGHQKSWKPLLLRFYESRV